MPGFLDGGLSKALYAGFKNKLLKGTLRRQVVGDSSGLDGLGDPVAPEPVSFTCQGFTDKYSKAYAMAAGIPLTDVKVCIFEQSLATRPAIDDLVGLVRHGITTWYCLRDAETDPAEALWTCQATQVPAP